MKNDNKERKLRKRESYQMGRQNEYVRIRDVARKRFQSFSPDIYSAS